MDEAGDASRRGVTWAEGVAGGNDESGGEDDEIIESGDEDDESSDLSDDLYDEGLLATASTLNVDDSGRRVTAVGTLDLSPPEADLGEGHTPFDIAFHPTNDLIAVGCVSGRVSVLAYSPEGTELVVDNLVHSSSCRSLGFSATGGQYLFTGGSDFLLQVLDLNQGGATAFALPEAHSSPISVIQPYGEQQLFSGDDSGVIRLWDLRQQKAAFELTDVHTDFISTLLPSLAKQRTISLSGDGYLASIDMRKGAVEEKCEEQEDELLSGAIMKNGSKVVVGTQAGILAIWTWGQWGDMTDRFPGHPHSIDALVKIDEDAICTGSSDGLIRLVSIHPNALMGVVGHHGDMPIERLQKSHDGRTLASISHDTVVRFWDISYFEDDGDGDDDEPEGEILATVPDGLQQQQMQQQQFDPAVSEGKVELDAPFFGGLL
jgi:WD repeat-containing protein 55